MVAWMQPGTGCEGPKAPGEALPTSGVGVDLTPHTRGRLGRGQGAFLLSKETAII